MFITLPSSLQDVKIDSLPDSAFYISDFISPNEEEYLLNKITTQSLSTWRTLSHRRLQCYPTALLPDGSLPSTAKSTSIGTNTANQIPIWLSEPLISRILSLRLHPESSKEPASTESAPAESPTNTNSAPDPASEQGLFSTFPHRRPNHILVNEYPPGIGISPHEDGAAYHPIVATVSLGGSTVLDVHPKNNDGNIGDRSDPWQILQERRSLLITMEDVYRDCLHGIEGREVDEGLGEGSVVNWKLLREETRVGIERDGGSLKRGLRISATIRDVIKVKDYSRILPGLGGRR